MIHFLMRFMSWNYCWACPSQCVRVSEDQHKKNNTCDCCRNNHVLP